MKIRSLVLSYEVPAHTRYPPQICGFLPCSVLLNLCVIFFLDNLYQEHSLLTNPVYRGSPCRATQIWIIFLRSVSPSSNVASNLLAGPRCETSPPP